MKSSSDQKLFLEKLFLSLRNPGSWLGDQQKTNAEDASAAGTLLQFPVFSS